MVQMYDVFTAFLFDLFLFIRLKIEVFTMYAESCLVINRLFNPRCVHTYLSNDVW